MEPKHIVLLGTLEITSGKIIVRDPCYPISIGGLMIVKAKNGKWLARVYQVDEGVWGMRNTRLRTTHIDHLDDEGKIVELLGEMGVDSGQAGIFDVISFENDAAKNSENWVRHIYAITTKNKYRAGIIEKGVVSRAGFGDGGYPVYGVYNESGELIDVTIVFIDCDGNHT